MRIPLSSVYRWSFEYGDLFPELALLPLPHLAFGWVPILAKTTISFHLVFQPPPMYLWMKILDTAAIDIPEIYVHHIAALYQLMQT